MDTLDRLGWANLSTADPGAYWFSVGLALTFTGFIQVMITRELKEAFMLRSRLLKEILGEKPTTHFVRVQGLPQRYRNEIGIRAVCGQWRSHLKYIKWLPQRNQSTHLLDRRRRCVQILEMLEAQFIARMVHDIRAGKPVMLGQELARRYQNHGSSWTSQCLARCRGLMPYSWQRMASLYGAVTQLSREQQQEASVPAPSSPTAVLAFDSQQIALLLSESEATIDTARVDMRYLGTSSSGILVHNISQSAVHSALLSEGVTLCTIILVILSSVPMGAIGAVSQLNTILILLGRLRGLDMPESVVGLIQGASPQLLTSMLMLSMRGLLRILARWRRCLSQAEAQMSIQSSYFWFLFTQLFITTSISTGLISTISKMLNMGLLELPRTLAQNLPTAGNYYLAYIPLQTALDLVATAIYTPILSWLSFRRLQWHPPRLVLRHIKDQRLGFPLGEIYPPVTIIAVIAFVIIYALFSPLILPLAACCAAVSRIRLRYAQAYVSKASSPTDGELYVSSLLSLFWGLLVMELAFIGLFILKLNCSNLKHDAAQLTTLLLSLYGTVRYKKHAARTCNLVAQGYGAPAGPTDLACIGTTNHEHEFLSRASPPNNPPVGDGVVWIAQDPEGVSDALVAFVRSRFPNPYTDAAVITNAHATLDLRGNVAFDALYNGEQEKNQ